MGAYGVLLESKPATVKEFTAPDVTVEASDYYASFDVSAQVPLCSSFTLGVEYGISKDDTQTVSINKRLISEEDISSGFSVDVLPGMTYYYRAYLIDKTNETDETETRYDSNWKSFKTPDEETTDLTLGEPVDSSPGKDEDRYRFKAETAGSYRVSVSIDLGSVDSLHSFVEFLVCANPYADWTGNNYDSADSIETLLYLEKDEVAYIRIFTYNGYSILVEPYDNGIDGFTAPEVTLTGSQDNFYTMLLVTTDVPLWGTFRAGVEIGGNTSETEIYYMYRHVNETDTPTSEKMSISTLPDHTYFFRGILEDTATGRVYTGAWKTLTTSANENLHDLTLGERETFTSMHDAYLRYTAGADGFYDFKFDGYQEGTLDVYARTSDAILGYRWTYYSVSDDVIRFNLRAGQSVYVMTNSRGTGYYGVTVQQFTPTVDKYSLPEVQVGEVDQLSAQIDLSATVTLRSAYVLGVEIGESKTNTTELALSGSYSALLENVSVSDVISVLPGKTYYVRAFLYNRDEDKYYRSTEWTKFETPADTTFDSMALDSTLERYADIGAERYYKFTASEAGCYRFDFVAGNYSGEIYRFDNTTMSWVGAWTMDEGDWTDAYSVRILKAGETEYLRYSSNESRPYSVTVKKIPQTVKVYSEPVLEVKSLNDYSAVVMVTADVPIGSAFGLGVQYGISKSASEVIRPCCYYTTYSLTETAYGIDSSLDLIPDTTYYCRAYIFDLKTETYKYGKWVELKMPTPENSTKLTAGVDQTIQVNPDEARTPLYFSFTPEKDGYYSIHADGVYGTIAVLEAEWSEEINAEAEAALMDHVDRYTAMWINRSRFGYDGAEIVTFLAAGNTAYFCLTPYQIGTYSIGIKEEQRTLSAYTPTVGKVKADAYTAEISFSATVPLGSTFEFGVEYGHSRTKTTTATAGIIERALKEMEESLEGAVTIPTQPGTTYVYRTYIITSATK